MGLLLLLLATDGRQLNTHGDYIPSHDAPRPHKQPTPVTPISHIHSVAPQHAGNCTEGRPSFRGDRPPKRNPSGVAATVQLIENDIFVCVC